MQPVGERDGAHVFDTGHRIHRPVARLDGASGVDKRRQRRATQAGRCRPGHCLGKPAGEYRLPGEVSALLALLVCTPEPEVIPLDGRDTGPVNKCSKHSGDEVFGMCPSQCAILRYLWRSYGIDNNGLRVGSSHPHRFISRPPY